MFKFRQLPIGRQIFIVTALLCAVVFSALISIVNYKSAQSAAAVATQDLRSQLKVVVDLMEYAYKQGINRANRNAHQFEKSLPGPITVDTKTIKTGPTELPIVRVGGKVVNGDPALLEEFQKMVGVESAILMRYNGELYRVISLLKDKDGKPTHGTIIPKGDPQTVAYNKGVEAGTMVERNGRVYSSHMIPVKDDKGNMVAAITSRVELTADMAEFKKIILGVTIGKTGGLFAFRPTTEEEGGVYSVHAKFEGKSLREVIGDDPENFAKFREVIKTRGGQVNYQWPDPADGGKRHEKLALFVHVPSWGWVVGGGTYMDELLVEAHALRNELIVESAVAALLLVGLLYLLVMASFARLKPVMAAMASQGNGDLTASVAGVAEQSRNEIDVLARCFNQSSAQIRALILSLAGAVQRIGGSSDELERSAGEIAKSTSQQSDAANSMAASVEELTVSIGHVADSAADASASTQAAKQASGEGRVVIDSSIAEMQRIAAGINGSAQQINQLGERSRQISGIVKVIGEIASQTNLLALNAAIEAARAGEQGKGFAVVADEVRKLSERTGASAQEIAKMIGTIQTETQSAVERMNLVAHEMTGGVALVKDVGASLEKIDVRTQETTTLAGQIAGAVKEQKAASEDIARRLEAIAQAAEENAALTGNNREVAQSLRQCAGELQSQIGRFRVGEPG